MIWIGRLIWSSQTQIAPSHIDQRLRDVAFDWAPSMELGCHNSNLLYHLSLCMFIFTNIFCFFFKQILTYFVSVRWNFLRTEGNRRLCEINCATHRTAILPNNSRAEINNYYNRVSAPSAPSASNRKQRLWNQFEKKNNNNSQSHPEHGANFSKK